MKRLCVVMLMLALLVPAIGHAGSATSRWDLTIGGTVKFDMGWTDSKGSGVLNAASLPGRNDASGFDTATGNNKYGNWLWGSGETGLNFGIRGPEAWGAKTRAYISGDFIGAWGGSTYNTFDLMLAYMAFDWTNTSLLIGQAGGAFGMLPTFAYNVAWGSNGNGGKGPAPVAPQITLTQNFGKNWSVKFGILSQQDGTSGINSTTLHTTTPPSSIGPTSYTRAAIPFLHGGVTYGSDACGKVGPWQLTFGVSGVYGREKKVFTESGTSLGDTGLDVWQTDFKFLVPIIPEKNGNKALALYVDGDIFIGQNLGGGYYGGFGAPANGTLSYVRGNAAAGNFGANTAWGYYLHGAFYATDKLWFNAFYWRSYNNSSDTFKTLNPNSLRNAYDWTFNVMYDVNPAVRLAAQYEYTKASYAGAAANQKQYGDRNTYRFAAYYYF